MKFIAKGWESYRRTLASRAQAGGAGTELADEGADMTQERMFGITIEEQIACVEREIGFRERVYARWVDSKRMTQQKADHEIAAMKAVLNTLKEKCSHA